MVISMAVLLIPILAIVWFFQRAPDEPNVPSVDVAPVVAQAKQAGLAAQAPSALPDGWKPVRATFTESGGPLLGHGAARADTLVIGYQGPDQRYYSMNQQRGSRTDFVQEFTGEGHRDGTSTIAGITWQRWTSADAQNRSLVREVSGSTVVVSGSASFEALEAFAGTLAAA